MFSLDLETDDNVKDLLIADLWEHGSTGVVETELPKNRWLLRAFFDPKAGPDSLMLRFAANNPRLEWHAERDWVAESRARWAPLAVGRKFYLVPEWMDDPPPAGRFRIAINPGLACGTGYHEATQLCIEALEEYASAGITVLDVGTGAGILSIIASRLGAGQIIACDTDPTAIEIAGAAFERAGITALLFTGSAGTVRSASADLIVSNISAAAAIELAPELRRILRPAGRCIVSGFPFEESAPVAEALDQTGWSIERKLVKG